MYPTWGASCLANASRLQHACDICRNMKLEPHRCCWNIKPSLLKELNTIWGEWYCCNCVLTISTLLPVVNAVVYRKKLQAVCVWSTGTRITWILSTEPWKGWKNSVSITWATHSLKATMVYIHGNSRYVCQCVKNACCKTVLKS